MPAPMTACYQADGLPYHGDAGAVVESTSTALLQVRDRLVASYDEREHCLVRNIRGTETVCVRSGCVRA